MESGPPSLEERQLETDIKFREREIALKEREQKSRESEIELKRRDHDTSKWRNPLIVAVFAAIVAAVGNAFVAYQNSNQQRILEREKAEQARILEVIKTGNDPDKAADNLKFLLDSGLIANELQKGKLEQFLANREPGTGPSLPSESNPPIQGISGVDDAVDLEQLPATSEIRKTAVSVGRIQTFQSDDGVRSYCTAFPIANDTIATLSHCLREATRAQFVLSSGGKAQTYEIRMPPEPARGDVEKDFILLKLATAIPKEFAPFHLSTEPPTVGERLTLLMFRADDKKLVVTDTPECRITAVGEDQFHHNCDTGGGSSGAPLLSKDGSRVLGLHMKRDAIGGIAIRGDAINKSVKAIVP